MALSYVGASLGYESNLINGYVPVGKINYPGNNPSKRPAPGFEWRGAGDPSSGKCNWYNPSTKEMLHPDLNHPAPIGPHWDYTDKFGVEYRIMPYGSKVPKIGGK